MRRKIRIWFIDFLTKKLLRAVTEEEILQVAQGKVFYKGRQFTREDVLILKEEAEAFEESMLWRLMKKDIEWVSFMRMTAHATVPDDITFGKAMFYDLDLIKKYIQTIKDLK